MNNSKQWLTNSKDLHLLFYKKKKVIINAHTALIT